MLAEAVARPCVGALASPAPPLAVQGTVRGTGRYGNRHVCWSAPDQVRSRCEHARPWNDRGVEDFRARPGWGDRVKDDDCIRTDDAINADIVWHIARDHPTPGEWRHATDISP